MSKLIDACPKKVQCAESRDVTKYLEDRLQCKINIYTCKGDQQKYIYRFTATLSMVAAATVPVMINLNDGWGNGIATILSLLVTVLVGFQAIFRPREHWRNYDLIASALRREEMLFSTRTGDYNIENEKQRFRHLVSRVEDLISKEREETIIMRTNDPDKPVESTPSESK